MGLGKTSLQVVDRYLIDNVGQTESFPERAVEDKLFSLAGSRNRQERLADILFLKDLSGRPDRRPEAGSLT